MAIRRRAAAALLLTSGFGASCANDAPDEARAPTTPTTRVRPTTTLPDLSESFGLAASIRQYREDEVAGVIQVQLVRAPGGDSTDLLTVRSVQLAWPGFTPVAATARTVALAPGQRVDVPTPRGGAVCDGATPSFSQGAVLLEIDEPTGTRTVTAPLLADAQTALDNVHTKACAQQRVDQSVGVSFAPEWRRTDRGGVPTASGALVVTRRAGGGAIVVRGLDGSVLLVVDAATHLPASMGADETTLEVPVDVRASGRCDGHALGDSKKTYAFQVQLNVDGDLAVDTEVTVPEAERGVLSGVIADTCDAARGR